MELLVFSDLSWITSNHHNDNHEKSTPQSFWSEPCVYLLKSCLRLKKKKKTLAFLQSIKLFVFLFFLHFFFIYLCKGVLCSKGLRSRMKTAFQNITQTVKTHIHVVEKINSCRMLGKYHRLLIHLMEITNLCMDELRHYKSEK